MDSGEACPNEAAVIKDRVLMSPCPCKWSEETLMMRNYMVFKVSPPSTSLFRVNCSSILTSWYFLHKNRRSIKRIVYLEKPHQIFLDSFYQYCFVDNIMYVVIFLLVSTFDQIAASVSHLQIGWEHLYNAPTNLNYIKLHFW